MNGSAILRILMKSGHTDRKLNRQPPPTDSSRSQVQRGFDGQPPGRLDGGKVDVSLSCGARVPGPRVRSRCVPRDASRVPSASRSGSIRAPGRIWGSIAPKPLPDAQTLPANGAQVTSGHDVCRWAQPESHHKVTMASMASRRSGWPLAELAWPALRCSSTHAPSKTPRSGATKRQPSRYTEEEPPTPPASARAHPAAGR